MAMSEAVEGTGFQDSFLVHHLDTGCIGKREGVFSDTSAGDFGSIYSLNFTLVGARPRNVPLVSTVVPLRGPFATAVAHGPTRPIDALVDNADPQHLQIMCKELLHAVVGSCCDLQWDRLARLVLDWVDTLEVAAEDEDGSLQRAREQLRRGQGLSFDEFCEGLSAQD